ncbi:MAG TPA: VOC family protein [Thermoanaerobaculia bacterium]|jgi:predicted enzyme related to lactoylglutathione lyase|nr:VOC family protein [Thermoanaerobaculia bacterium]
MAKVLGIGGVFFRSPEPAALCAWYKEWLGVEATPPYGATFEPATLPPGGLTVWAPFPQDTPYFGPSGQTFMFNLIVDDLRGALAQVAKGGATVDDKVEDHDYGSFGWFVDPDGNRVELWQPKGPANPSGPDA